MKKKTKRPSKKEKFSWLKLYADNIELLGFQLTQSDDPRKVQSGDDLFRIAAELADIFQDLQ